MEPRKKYTTGIRVSSSKGELGSPVGMAGISAKSTAPPTSTVISTLRRERIRSLTMPQNAREAMDTPEVRALSRPSWEAENPTSCR